MHRLALSRRQLLQAGAAASVLTAPWAAAQKAAATPLPAVGAPYPLAAVPLLGGGRFEPAQAEGRALVLYWWASWCPFCAQQSPEMQKLWAAQKDRGLRMLALSIDKKPTDIPPFLKSKNYTFPVAWLSPALAKVLPKPAGLPVTIVIGRDGRVKMADSGELFAEDIAGIAKFL